MASSSKNFKKTLVHSDARRKPRRARRAKGKKRGRMAIYGGAINQLTSDVKAIYRMLNVEDKYIDTGFSAAVTSGAWGSTVVNTMVQGTTASTRIGQSVKTVGIECRWTIITNSASTNPQFFRVVIFIDKQADGASPTFTNVYPLSVIGARVDGYIEEFTVLYDKVVALSPNGSEACVESFIRTLTFHTTFVGNAGTIADIQTNALWIMWYSDQAANMPTFSHKTRYIYVDN